MLSSMRSQKKILSVFLWLVIAAFIGTIFFAWGVGEKAQNSNYVARVNDTVIKQAEYQNAYENTLATLQQLFGDQARNITDSDELRYQVVSDLIDEALLAVEADRMQVPVSDAEVAGYISTVSSFQVNGQFDTQRYQEILASNRLNPAQYEATVRRSLVVDKMRTLIEGSVAITDAEVQSEYDFRNTRARISYLPVAPEKFADEARGEATDEALAAYYEENKELYRTPARIKVKYVTFDPENFDPELSITDANIETYFIQHAEEFRVEESVTAGHILVRVNDWNNEDEVKSARSKIEGIHKQIKAGKDFRELAKQFSEDTTAANGGDLGSFTKGQMVPEFEEAAFALASNEVSSIVKTDFGFHIIKVYEHVEPKDPTAADVKDEIRERLIADTSESQFRSYVIGVYRDVIESSNLSGYLAQDNVSLSARTTDFFSRDNTEIPFAANQQIASTLFALEVSEVSQVMSIGDTRYIFEIDAREESVIPSFENVKEQVRRDYISDESLALAVAAAKNAAEQGSLKNAAAEFGVSIQSTDAFTRSEPIPGIGVESTVTQEIFNAETGSVITEAFIVEDVVYLIRVDAILPPAPEDLDSQYAEIVEYLKPIKADGAYASYMDELKANAEIDINPSFQRP